MKGLGYDEENWESRKDFYKEIKFLARKYNVNETSIDIDVNHPCGDICIFVNDKWCGYIDSFFYSEMECGLVTPWDFE